MSFRYTGNHRRLHDEVCYGVLLQAVCASISVGFTDRFKHMYPGVYKEAHPSFCPIFQLNVGLMFMDKWAFRFDVTQIEYSNSFNNGIMFDLVRGEPFGLLGKRFCNRILGGDILRILFFKARHCFLSSYI